MPAGRWDLSGAKLTGTNLKRGYFQDAVLRKADLRGVDLYKSTLRNANLAGANLHRASLSRCDLFGANLSDSDLSMASVSESDLSGAILTDANMEDGIFFFAEFNKANLKGANLKEANFKRAVLVGATLANATMVNTDFSFADLSGADLTGAALTGIITVGWTIRAVKASHIYYTSQSLNANEQNRHRVTLKEGEFESLFRSYPYIEVIFAGVHLYDDLLTMGSIVNFINLQKKEFNLKLAGMNIKGQYSFVRITTDKDEYLGLLSSMFLTLLQKAMKEGININSRLLDFGGNVYKILPRKQTLNINARRLTVNLIHSDGTLHAQSGKILESASNEINRQS
ncbi:MAG: pentapeptide repeat-containing protein [Nitrospirae bacterium YQR-1]